MLLPVRWVGPWGKKGLTGHPGLKTACAACGKGTEETGTWVSAEVTQACVACSQHLLHMALPA